MGLSGSKQTTGPSKFAQPYISAGAGAITDAYNTNKGPTGEIASSIQGLIPGLIDKYKAGNPNVTAASGYNQDVLGGKYLDPSNNPMLQNILAQTRNDAMGAVGGAFGRNGAFGGTKYAEAAGKGIGEAENGILFNQYNTERGNQATAAGQAPSLAAADYLGISPLLAAADSGTDLAYAPSDHYASALAQLLGNSTTSSSTPSTAQQIGSGLKAASSLASLFSDRRLKTNIRKIGVFADGLGKYAWTYIWGEPATGVMADEVERLRPWALGPIIGGYATVNYGAL
jgi:hypothetical protein